MKQTITQTPDILNNTISPNKLVQNVITCNKMTTELCLCDMSEEACNYPAYDADREEGKQIIQAEQGITIERQCFCGEYLPNCNFPDCEEGVVEEKPRQSCDDITIGSIKVCPKKLVRTIHFLQGDLNKASMLELKKKLKNLTSKK